MTPPSIAIFINNQGHSRTWMNEWEPTQTSCGDANISSEKWGEKLENQYALWCSAQINAERGGWLVAYVGQGLCLNLLAWNTQFYTLLRWQRRNKQDHPGIRLEFHTFTTCNEAIKICCDMVIRLSPKVGAREHHLSPPNQLLHSSWLQVTMQKWGITTCNTVIWTSRHKTCFLLNLEDYCQKIIRGLFVQAQ